MTTETPTPVNPLEQALASILQKTVNAVEAGVSFLSDQLPDVIQQLLIWHAVKSGVWFVITLICTIVLGRWLYKTLKSPDCWDDYGPLPILFGGAVVFLFVITFKNLDWLQILVAPKLYLIEYAAELYKGTK